jgi:hypothetical protein
MAKGGVRMWTAMAVVLLAGTQAQSETITLKCFASNIGTNGTNYVFDMDLQARTVLYASGTQPISLPVEVGQPYLYWGPYPAASVPVNRLHRNSGDLMISNSRQGPWQPFATCVKGGLL